MSFFKTRTMQFTKQWLFLGLRMWFSRAHPRSHLKKFTCSQWVNKGRAQLSIGWDKKGAEDCGVWKITGVTLSTSFVRRLTPCELAGDCKWVSRSSGICWEPCTNVRFPRDETEGILGRENRINTDADTRKFGQYLKNSWTQTPRDNKSNLFAIQVKVLIYLFCKYLLTTHCIGHTTLGALRHPKMTQEVQI